MQKEASGQKTIVAALVFCTAVFLNLAPNLQAAANKTPAAGSAKTNQKENDARGGIDGTTSLEPRQVYRTVLGHKSLRSSSQFKLVDDFNRRLWKNKLGGAWRLENGKAQKVALQIEQEDAREFKGGSSLKSSGTNLVELR